MPVRDARESDLPQILEIANDAVRHTTAVWNETPTTLEARAAWLQERRRQGYAVIVVEEDGLIAGFASLGPFRPFEGYARTTELSIYVHKDRRGQGHGGALLEALIERAKAAGMHVIVAGIAGDNTVSIRLHERHGFTEVGRMPEVGRKFGRWLDLVLMQRMLE
jgi:phosphinothricin acetyltransferase